MSQGHRSQLKESPVAKLKEFKQQNKVVLNYDPKQKINIQVHTDINIWLNKVINGKKRQISHTDKFQIIYVYTPHSRIKSITPHSLGAVLKWLHCKMYNMEREEKSNFPVEKPAKCNLSQVIKVNINSDKSCWFIRVHIQYALWILWDDNSSLPLWIFCY